MESRAGSCNFIGVEPKVRAEIVSNKYVDCSEFLKYKHSEHKF